MLVIRGISSESLFGKQALIRRSGSIWDMLDVEYVCVFAGSNHLKRIRSAEPDVMNLKRAPADELEPLVALRLR